MIDDDLFGTYLVAARVPADQWVAQHAIRDSCVSNGTAFVAGRTFVLWFETDAAGADDLRAGYLPAVVKGGPIFYGWAMLGDGKDTMLPRRLFKASGCKTMVFDRWQKGTRDGAAPLSLVERQFCGRRRLVCLTHPPSSLR